MPRSTITSKGQITIPKELRDRLGLETGTVLEFVEDDRGRILLSKSGEKGALGSLRHRALGRPVSVDEMKQAIRRKARSKSGAHR